MATLVTDEDVAYMLRVIERVCTEVGPGIPCSPQEHERAMVLKSEMEEVVGAENVEVEEVVLAPKALFGWFRWGAVLTLLSVALFFFRELSGMPRVAVLTAFLCILAVNVAAVFEFFLFTEFVDVLFKKRKSENLIGTVRRKDERPEDVERVLIVSGHHDSAIQFNWLTYLGFGYYIVQGLILAGLVSVLLGTGAELFALVFFGESPAWIQDFMIWTSLFVTPFGFVGCFFFLGPQQDGGTVPGAADNLSGCAAALGVGRVLARHPDLIPARTEVRLITFGAEEAGTGGRCGM